MMNMNIKVKFHGIVNTLKRGCGYGSQCKLGSDNLFESKPCFCEARGSGNELPWNCEYFKTADEIINMISSDNYVISDGERFAIDIGVDGYCTEYVGPAKIIVIGGKRIND
jgi:hypothetical protein